MVSSSTFDSVPIYRERRFQCPVPFVGGSSPLNDAYYTPDADPKNRILWNCESLLEVAAHPLPRLGFLMSTFRPIPWGPCWLLENSILEKVLMAQTIHFW